MKEYLFYLDVYYEDTDAGGVVYHSNYLKFTERARTQLLKDNNIFQSKLLNENNILFVVRSQNIEYLKPAKLDDKLTIRTIVTGINKASFTLKQTVLCDDILLIDSDVKIACIDSSGRPKKSPDFIRNVLLKYM